MATYPNAFGATAPLLSGDDRDNRSPAIAAGDPFGNNAEHALLEYQTRKRLAEIDSATVTAQELKASRRRLHAIRAVEAEATHGVGMGEVLAAIKANGAAIEANGAAILNIRRRERNRNNDWTPILVERVGDNPVGVAPPHHPASREEVLRMTGAQISNLEAAFNLPVGRFAGADLAARRSLVLDYLLES